MRAVYVLCIPIAVLLLSPSFASPVALALLRRTTTTPSCKKLNTAAGKQPQPRSLSYLSSPTNTPKSRDGVGVRWFVPGTQLSIVLHTLTISTGGFGPIGVAIARTLVDAVNEVDEHFNRHGDGIVPTFQPGEDTTEHNMAGLVYLLMNEQRGSTLRVNVLRGQWITYWVLSAAFRAVYNLMCEQGFGTATFNIYVADREIARGRLS